MNPPPDLLPEQPIHDANDWAGSNIFRPIHQDPYFMAKVPSESRSYIQGNFQADHDRNSTLFNTGNLQSHPNKPNFMPKLSYSDVVGGGGLQFKQPDIIQKKDASDQSDGRLNINNLLHSVEMKPPMQQQCNKQGVIQSKTNVNGRSTGKTTFGIATRSASRLGGTAAIPAYSGREVTASPRGSDSDSSFDYSDHTSYHGSSLQSSFYGEDDYMDDDQLSSSGNEFVRSGQNGVVEHLLVGVAQAGDLQPPAVGGQTLSPDQMVFFNHWVLSNPRLILLRTESPVPGRGYAFRWGTYHVTATDMRKIGGPFGWFDDNFISCVFEIIKHRNLYENITDCFLVNPLYGHIIAKSNSKTRQTAPIGLVRSISCAISQGRYHSLIATNVDNNHWMSVFIQFPKHDENEVIITGVEVISVNRTYVLERFKDFVSNSWHALYPRKRAPSIIMRMVMPPVAPHMTDGCSCGPFMCAFFDMFCREIPIQDFKIYVNQRNIAEVRRRTSEFMTGFCCRLAYHPILSFSF